MAGKQLGNKPPLGSMKIKVENTGSGQTPTVFNEVINASRLMLLPKETPQLGSELLLWNYYYIVEQQGNPVHG